MSQPIAATHCQTQVQFARNLLSDMTILLRVMASTEARLFTFSAVRQDKAAGMGCRELRAAKPAVAAPVAMLWAPVGSSPPASAGEGPADWSPDRAVKDS